MAYSDLNINAFGSDEELQSFEYPGLNGVDYISSPLKLPANMSPNAWNADFGNPIGDINKAPGYESLITSLGTGSMKGLHSWPHSTGDKMLAAWSKNLYVISGDSGSIAKTSKADWDAGTKTHIETGIDIGDMFIERPGTDVSETVTISTDFDGTHSNTEAAGDLVRLTSTTAQWGISSMTPGTSIINEDNNVTIGYKFTTSASGAVVDKVRLYIYTGVTHTVKIWSITGTELASVNISSTPNTWCEGTLSSNLTLAANTSYVISVYVGTVEYYYAPARSNVALSGLFTFNEERIKSGGGYGFPETAGGNYVAGVLDLHAIQVYSLSGTYTHGELDVSGAEVVSTATITYNKTTPSNTSVTVETCYSLDGGTNCTAWTSRASGDTIIPASTIIDNGRVYWRATLTTSDGANTPSLNDVTISVTAGYYDEATWISPVYDCGNTPNSNTLSWAQITPGTSIVTWYAAGSSNGTIFGDWQEVTTSGDAIPLQRYIQLKAVLTGPSSTTPSISSLLISYTTGYTVPYKLDIGPLGRTSDELTGNRISWVDYEDWLLCADGERPFMVYITTGTQTTGTAQAGAANTITLASGASAVNDFYNNAFITITGGTGSGQIRWINDYVGASKVATVSVAWTTQPDATSTYSISSAYKVRNLGVDPPTAALTATASGTSGSPNGTYYYKVTYVNADDVEGNPSAASASVTVSSKQISLTSIPVDSSTGNMTTKRRIYRTAAGGSVYKYVTEIADNTATTYTDNTADSALGSLMEDNNNIPPNCTLMYQFTSYVFMVGTDGYTVWFSKAGSPDQVPNITGDIQTIVFPGKVADIKSHPMALIMAGPAFQASITSNSGFIFDSDSTVDTTTMKIIDSNGGLSFEASAMCLSPDLRSTLVMNTNTGLRAVVPGLQDNSVESVPLSYEIQPFYELSINRDQAAGVFYNNYYHYSMEYMASGAAESQILTFAYDMRTKKWYGPWEFGFACYTMSGNVLYAGDAENGKIYRLHSGTSYAGGNIHLKVDFPTISPNGPQKIYKFRRWLPIVHADSVTTSTILKPKVGDKEKTIALGTLTSSFTGDERPGDKYIRPKKKYKKSLKGSYHSARIEDDSTNPFRMSGLVVEYEQLETNR